MITPSVLRRTQIENNRHILPSTLNDDVNYTRDNVGSVFRQAVRGNRGKKSIYGPSVNPKVQPSASSSDWVLLMVPLLPLASPTEYIEPSAGTSKNVVENLQPK